mgnify:CR=1 FL=1
MAGKLIIFSAPSGSGKSTIINFLLKQNLNLHFSISATSRAPRGTEKDGVEYYFLTPDEFRARIAAGDFLEYEEVYTDKYYGTLKSEVERRLMSGDNVIFDVDVVGGCNIKKFYGDRALSVFIQPPSIEDLRSRLEGRGTDAPEVIESRIAKAEFELGFADKFDVIVVNDKLEVAQKEALKVIKEFLKKSMNGKKLSKKWLYTFIGIAFVALATCTAALYYKEYIIATGTGLVFGAQVINIIKWKRD